MHCELLIVIYTLEIRSGHYINHASYFDELYTFLHIILVHSLQHIQQVEYDLLIEALK